MGFAAAASFLRVVIAYMDVGKGREQERKLCLGFLYNVAGF